MPSTPHHHRFFGRTLARGQALQVLFQAEVCDRAVDDVLAGDYALSQGPIDEYGERLARGAGEHILELDDVLSGAARNWSLSRMSSTDRNLLRIALYEILYVDDVDPSVSISECVELAKAFGSSDESSRFVNGVLGRIVSDLEAGVDIADEARKHVVAEYGEDAVPAIEGDADTDEADGAEGSDVGAAAPLGAEGSDGVEVAAASVDASADDNAPMVEGEEA